MLVVKNPLETTYSDPKHLRGSMPTVVCPKINLPNKCYQGAQEEH